MRSVLRTVLSVWANGGCGCAAARKPGGGHAPTLQSATAGRSEGLLHGVDPSGKRRVYAGNEVLHHQPRDGHVG